eukprot:3262020-Amphidinium_carterae.1
MVPGIGEPNARQYGAAVLVYKACRAACPMPVDQSSAAASATSVVVAAATVDERVVKLNLTVDPAREETVAVMTAEEVEGAYLVFNRIMGAPPSPEEEATWEQLSAVRALLARKLPPY